MARDNKRRPRRARSVPAWVRSRIPAERRWRDRGCEKGFSHDPFIVFRRQRRETV